MTTKGISLRRRDTAMWQPTDADKVKPDVPPARRETIMQSLQLLQAEAARVELTRAERREVVRRINTLRNLLGWPSL